MTPKPDLSVVVPAKDAEDCIGECLTALEDQSLANASYEVIVVDDGSTDQTATIAHAHHARVISQPNRGPASARNQGVAAARGGIVVFTDADCRPSRDFLARMKDAFADPSVAGAKGAYRSNQSEIMARFVQNEFGFKHQRMARRETIDAVHTYAAAFRREVFARNAGFDETYRVPSNEDQEFSYRLAEQGYRLVFVPQATVFHRHDRTLWEYVVRKFILGYWKAYTLVRHPEHLTGDSHTPFGQLAQIALVGPMSLALALSFLTRVLLHIGLALVAGFLVSTWPFIRYLYQKEKRLVLIAPGVIYLRAAAQAAGLGIGFVRWLLFR